MCFSRRNTPGGHREHEAIEGYLKGLQKHGDPAPPGIFEEIIEVAGYRRLSVPNHKELAKGNLRALIREVGLTVEEFAGLV